MQDRRRATPPPVIATLEHLTGPSRGTVTWLSQSAIDISLTPARMIRVSTARSDELPEGMIARLRQTDGTYDIETPTHLKVWVNGAPVSAKRLEHCDMVEFGESGPLSRFRLQGDRGLTPKTVTDIAYDTIDYLRTSRRPFASRAISAVSGLTQELVNRTTILFRVSVIIAVIGLAILAYNQQRLTTRLEKSVERSAAQMDSFSAALARSREEALRPSDLAALREELGQRVISNVERLKALEQRSAAAPRVIAESIPAVAFLQGAHGFRERSSGRMLRHIVDENGHLLISPFGRPMLSLDSDGPVAQVQFIGTGFLVGDGNFLVTNRHVARPAEDASMARTLADGLEPVIMKFIAYFPGRTKPVPVELLLASESEDLAVLKLDNRPQEIKGLKLAETLPRPGDEVIVMGYPTGLRSMLTQSGKKFVEQLQRDKTTGFWEVAARLAKEGYVAPLASMGIVGQASPETVVYDAETTHGGSGGPVLNVQGDVIAVNTAVMREYGGSNLGVPAAKARALLEKAGLRQE
jgi:S1-C subfamily serine protease